MRLWRWDAFEGVLDCIDLGRPLLKKSSWIPSFLSRKPEWWSHNQPMNPSRFNRKQSRRNRVGIWELCVISVNSKINLIALWQNWPKNWVTFQGPVYFQVSPLQFSIKHFHDLSIGEQRLIHFIKSDLRLLLARDPSKVSEFSQLLYLLSKFFALIISTDPFSHACVFPYLQARSRSIRQFSPASGGKEDTRSAVWSRHIFAFFLQRDERISIVKSGRGWCIKRIDWFRW